MQGLRPLHPLGLEPLRHWLALPLWCPAGGAPALPVRRALAAPRGACVCRPPTPPLACFFRPPSPKGRISSTPSGEGGGERVILCKGFAPCIPAPEPARHLFALPLWCPVGGLPRRSVRRALAAPCGGLLSLSPAYPAFSLISFPHPPTPFPSGEGGRLKVILCKGLRPLHPRGLNPGGTCSPSRCGARRGACPGVAGSAGVGGTLRGLAFFVASRPRL